MSWNCPGCSRDYNGSEQRYPYNLCRNCFFNSGVVDRFKDKKDDNPSSRIGQTASMSGTMAPYWPFSSSPPCPSGPNDPSVSPPDSVGDPSDASTLVSAGIEPEPIYDIDKSFDVDPNPHSDLPYVFTVSGDANMGQKPDIATIANDISEMKRLYMETAQRLSREDGFYRKIIPPIKISNDELDRSIPCPPFGYVNGEAVTFDMTSFLNGDVNGKIKIPCKLWEELWPYLRVATVSPYRRTYEEMCDEVAHLNNSVNRR